MKRIILSLVLLFSCLIFISPTAGAAWSLFPTNACSGKATSSAVCQDKDKGAVDNPLTGSGGLITKISSLVAVVAGVAAVIMLIIGAVKLITSGGSTEKVASAKKTIIFAVVGLLVVALSETIILLVINRV